jgi:hypothetical protein
VKQNATTSAKRHPFNAVHAQLDDVLAQTNDVLAQWERPVIIFFPL